MRGLKRKRVLALILVAAMILTLNRGVSAESLQDLTKGDATIESQVENQPSVETADPEKEDPAAVSDAPNAEAEPADPAPAEVPTDDPAPAEAPAEEPAPVEAPAEVPAPVEVPAEEPAEDPKEDPAPVEEPAEEPAPVEEPAEEPAEDPAPVEAPVEEPAAPAAAVQPEAAKDDPVERPVVEEPIVVRPFAPLQTVYTKELNEVVVLAEVAEGAFDEEVELFVRVFEKDSADWNKAKASLLAKGYSFDGMLAYDIGFASKASGTEIEPKGAVSVKLEVLEAGLAEMTAKAIDATSIVVSHISGSTVEKVADAATKSGRVEMDAEKLTASFSVDSFSTFVITWENEDEEEESATIHWVYLDGETYKEFESSTTIDANASSVDLAVNINGYYYTGAKYKTSETEDGVVVDGSVIRKDANGKWTVDTLTYDEDDNETKTTVTIADGSHIYVYYAEKGSGGYTPPTPAPATLDNIAPDTEKDVQPNGDGTYTIRLDITGHATEDTKQGANVIVMLDMTYSMRQNDMNGTRIAAAKQALLALIDALNPGYDADHPDLNLVNFTLATFGNTMTTETVRTWTQDRSEMKSAVRGLSNQPGAMGTNWQGGLSGAEVLAEAANSDTNLKKNPTYVIFVTDGAPNCWQGHTSSNTGNDLDAAALPYAQTAANSLAQDAIFYGVFCGPASGYNNLANLVTEAHGAGTINGSTTAAIEAAFSQIAGTIVAGMAAANVTVDDGIPSLSNVSANVTAGEAGGFKYYIKPAGGTEKEWVAGATGENDKGAPGATYDESNGVTWDLGEAGTLQEGWVYSIEFTVWPSQEAYDTIADLNNGIITMTDAQLAAAGIGKNADGTYYLLTNTHLNTTFTDPSGNVYDVIEEDVVSEAMALPTTTLNVIKDWNNEMDSREATDVTLTITKDGADYIDVVMGEPTKTGTHTWRQSPTTDLYISYGQIVVASDGSYEIKEKGHEYTVIEPENFSYRWDLTADIYRPMIVNGVEKVLIKTDSPTGTEGTDYFVIEGNKYQVSADTTTVLKATNDRRSNLSIQKKVEGDAPEDAVFAIQLSIDNPNAPHPGDDDYSDYYHTIWFAVFTAFENGEVVKDVTVEEATPEGGNTGWYWFDNGGSATVYLKAGQWLKIGNLARDTEYTVTELLGEKMPDGFVFVEADSDAENMVDGETSTPAEIDENVAEGTIDKSNSEYYVYFTNKYEETSITVTKVWTDNSNQDGSRPSAEDFQRYISLLLNGTATEDYDSEDYLTITDNEDDTYTITYTGLPKYVNNEEAEYTIQETEVPENYTSEDLDPVEDGGEIENIRNAASLNVTKTVEAPEGYVDDTKEFSFTVTIKVDNAALTGEVETVKIDASGEEGTPEKVALTNGQVTFTLKNGETFQILGLPVGATYEVVEDEADGYTTTSTGASGTIAAEGDNTAAFTNELNTYDVTVTKTFSGITEDLVPSEFTVTPSFDGEAQTALTLTDADHDEGTLVYTWTLEDVPYGTEVSVTESGTDVTGWTLGTVTNSGPITVDTTGTQNVALTNPYTKNTYDVTVTKTFSGITEDLVPSGFTVTPSFDGEAQTALTLEDAEHEEGTLVYTWTIEDVPYGTEVSVTESGTDVTGWTLGTVTNSGPITVDTTGTQNIALTNPYAMDTATLKLVKEVEGLQGDDDMDTEVAFTISGTPTGEGVTFTDVVVTYGDIKDGKYEITVPIGTYTVEEDEDAADVDGYSRTTTYSEDAVVEKDGEATLTVTNTYTRIMIEVKVTKVWSDDDNALGIRPESITVQLLKDGTAYGDPAVLKESNKWTNTWSVPQYENGKLLEYTVKELAVEPYFAGLESIKDDLGYFEITLTNTLVWHDPPVLKKITNDKPENEDEFTFVLTPISGPEGVEMPMPEGNEKGIVKAKAGVETEFGNIYFYHEGTYVYTITEDGENPIAGYKYDKTVYTLTYVLTQEGTDLKMERTILKGEKVGEGEVVEVSAFEFTNEYTAPPIDIPVEKVWKGEVDPEKTRPKSITVVLLADGKDSGKTLVLTEETSWKGIFKELPSQDNGKKIKYTIQEVAVEYYTTTITGNMDEGFVITNICTYVPTGDDSNVLLWSASMMASMAGIGFVLKKKREEEAE